MTLVWDVETTGLWRKDLAPDDPSQPHVVSIAARLFDKDRRTVGHLNVLIRLDGWSIEAGAAAVHGITEAKANRYGIPIQAALIVFKGMVEQGIEVVAHNLAFDRQLIDRELRGGGWNGAWWERAAPKMHCTMEESTPICDLPGKFGQKYPSLQEAHAILVPEVPWTQAHSADDDVLATSRVLWALRDRVEAAR